MDPPHTIPSFPRPTSAATSVCLLLDCGSSAPQQIRNPALGYPPMLGVARGSAYRAKSLRTKLRRMTDPNAVAPTVDEFDVVAFVEHGLTAIANSMDQDPGEAVKRVEEFIDDVRPVPGLELRTSVRAYALVRAAGVLIDAATCARDQEALQRGVAVTQGVREDREVPASLRVTATHFKANALTSLISCELDDVRGNHSAMYRAFWDRRDLIREARVLQLEVCQDTTADDVLRSSAACNLANLLDDMGRWVEAYEWHQRSLDHDPTNGNAAGNIALLLRRVLASDWASPGHVAALHNHYLQIAKDLHEQTAHIAGAGTAERYADMPLIDGQVGHLVHAGDETDDYQRWIVENRLALAPTVEGLGNDGSHWDSATLSAGKAEPGQFGPPPVFGMLDALKAEFIAARRLAHSALCTLREFPASQGPGDSGTYAEFGDGVVHGEHVAQLVLAQRSALDTLDKLAVVANEHLGLGDDPTKVNFRKFWQTGSEIRAGLSHDASSGRAALALADLAGDLGVDGLYAHAQELRNAGTHRIVVASLTHGSASAARTSMSMIDLDTLIASALEALKAARAAFLYLIELFEDWLVCDPIDGPMMPLMDQWLPGDLTGEPG